MKFMSLSAILMSLLALSCNDDKSAKEKFASRPSGGSDEFVPPSDYQPGGIAPSATGDSDGIGVYPGDPPVNPSYNAEDRNTFTRDNPTPNQTPCVLDDQTKDGDFINFPWPGAIEACVASGKLYDFNANRCSTVPNETSYKCDWDDAYRVQTEEIGIPNNAIGAAERNQYAKLVGCGEIKDSRYHMIILQYWYPTLDDRNACKVVTNWRIYTSCRYLRKGHNVDMTWGECLQYQAQ